MGCTGLNLPTVALQEGDGYRLEILAVNTESFFKACWGAKQLLPLAGRSFKQLKHNYPRSRD